MGRRGIPRDRVVEPSPPRIASSAIGRGLEGARMRTLARCAATHRASGTHVSTMSTPMIEPTSAPEPIGRADLLAAAHRLVSTLPDGLAGLVLAGPAGIGKTTIFEAAVESAAEAGVRVLRARPAESERELTLGGLTDLFADVVDDELAGLPAPQRRSLGVALLRDEDPTAPNDQRTLSVAATGLVRHLAGSGAGVLVAIDDAQWLDASSSAILPMPSAGWSTSGSACCCPCARGAAIRRPPASCSPRCPRRAPSVSRSGRCRWRPCTSCSSSGSGARSRA